MSNISSINHLTDQGSGVYQINFNGTSKTKGCVQADSAVLAPLWYLAARYKFGTDWNWGSAQYGNDGQFLSNCKLFRMWNPGSTKENCYVEFSGYEGGGILKFVYETTSGNTGIQQYFASDMKNVFKAGTEHDLEFEFKDSDPNQTNGYFKMWINGAQKVHLENLGIRTNGGLKRPFILGIENEWADGPTVGGNTLTLSKIVLAENKTRDQYNGGTPPPPPPPPPPPSPPPTSPALTKQEFRDWVIKVSDSFKNNVP